MSAASVTQYILPDFISSCPLKDATNPHHEKAANESRRWISSYNVISDRKRSAYFAGEVELLCSHAYPFAGYEDFRTICDWVNFLFLVDEISDRQTGKDAKVTGDIVINALDYEKWDDGSMLSSMTKDFRERFIPNAGDYNRRHFIDCMKAYGSAFAYEAEMRQQNKIMDLTSFIEVRNNASAVPGCLVLVEYALGYNFSDEVWEHEVFKAARDSVIKHVSFSNDIFSYDMEQSRSLAGLNIVTVLMHENGISLQEAVDRAGDLVNKQLDIYLEAKAKAAHLGFSEEARRYIDAIGHWMIGNVVWSFEGQRYFGPRHEEVRRTHIVALSRTPDILPK